MSKYAHFFIDDKRFPIYDSHAVRMLEYHLGRCDVKGSIKRPYESFAARYSALADAVGLT